MFKKLKKQNGETFAQTIRNHHSGILEIPDLDIILRHAGRVAEPLIPYLMTLLTADDDNAQPEPEPQDPFTLLEQAGYNAFHADTLEKQNSIKPYFAKGELLCTFNDAARHKNYHIIHAIKTNVDAIKRKDFRGKEQRQDEYGTSVISIQMLKRGGFIKITNRYNHTVEGCDNTFNSNPDNIIQGLSNALKEHFNVDFSVSESPLPEGYVLIGNRILKYHYEHNNIYYGNQAWAKDGIIHTADRAAGDALFEGFLFNNKTKMMEKIDPDNKDSFADDFNRYYGGNRGLNVDKKGNLVLDGTVLIGAENSRIKTLYLPAMTAIGDYFLYYAPAVTQIDMSTLQTMGDFCFGQTPAVTQIDMPALQTMGDDCFYHVPSLTQIDMPALQTMGDFCLRRTPALTQIDMPALQTMGVYCLRRTPAQAQINMPALQNKGINSLPNIPARTQLRAASRRWANTIFHRLEL